MERNADGKIKKIGMLGGGQLGMMAAEAAKKLGYEVIPYDPNPNSPAFKICHDCVCAEWDDEDALRIFAKSVDVVTYEFENIPMETIDILSKFSIIWPDKMLLQIAQHRVLEKTYLNTNGIKTTDFVKVQNKEQVDDTLEQWGTDQCIIKTCRMGYDGKGQALYKKGEDFPKLKGELIAERLVDFDCEISVIVARGQNGEIKSYPPFLNEHKNHILHKTTAPAPIDKGVAAKAVEYAKQLAETVGLVGVLTLEMFITKDGHVLANEIAPRPHNSGHLTIEACETSQFEQQIRAVLSLPLGETTLKSPATMINLIGDDIKETAQYKDKPKTYLHNYGKPEVKEGRKMGHVTILS